MFNLANCRLYCSCGRGRCFKRLGAKAQIGCDAGVRGPGRLCVSWRKRHARVSHSLSQTKMSYTNWRLTYEYSTTSRPDRCEAYRSE